MPTSSKPRPARPTWCTSAAGRSGTAAAARSAARPRSCGCSGAATGGCGRRTEPGSPSSRSRHRTSPRIRSRRPRPDPISTAARLPIDFQWLRSPQPEELFSLSARPGHLRLYGRETIGSLFRQSLVARRQQAHCFSASHGDGLRARALPADGRPRLLLRRGQVPLPPRVARRDAGQVPGRHVGAPRLSAGRRLHGQGRDPGGPRRAARRGRRGADVLRLPRGRRGLAVAARIRSTPASSRTRHRRRACPTSRARSSAWPARTWRARRAMRTSTGSSTASARSPPIRAPDRPRLRRAAGRSP